MIRRGLSLLAATPLVLLAACGGDDDTPSAEEVQEQIEDAIDASLPPGVTMPDLGDLEDLTGISLPDDLDDLEDLADVSLPDLSGNPVGSGSCSVDVTGDITTSWTEQQNSSSALVSAWLTPEQVEIFGDAFSLLFNCTGEGGSLSVYTMTDATPAQIPQAPAEYPLAPGGQLTSESDLWALLVTFNDSDTNWSVAEPGGTLNITEYDNDSIRIEIDTPLYDALAEMTGSPAQSAHMTASLHVTR